MAFQRVRQKSDICQINYFKGSIDIFNKQTYNCNRLYIFVTYVNFLKLRGIEMIEEIGGDFLQWLRGFYFVARRQSVTRASLEMRRNQPAISHQIKCLENEFGVTLFDRSRGKMELTPEGKAFLDKAISVFEIIKEMKSDINKSYLETKGKVVISASHAIIHYFLPQYIVQFRKESPNVDFELEGGDVEMILERVESAEADFGIARLNTVPDRIIYHDLFETGLRLLAPKDNSFFSEQEPTLEQVARTPFIFFPHTSTITPLIESVFAENQLKLNVVLVLNNFDAFAKSRNLKNLVL